MSSQHHKCLLRSKFTSENPYIMSRLCVASSNINRFCVKGNNVVSVLLKLVFILVFLVFSMLALLEFQS